MVDSLGAILLFLVPRKVACSGDMYLRVLSLTPQNLELSSRSKRSSPSAVTFWEATAPIKLPVGLFSWFRLSCCLSLKCIKSTFQGYRWPRPSQVFIPTGY